VNDDTMIQASREMYHFAVKADIIQLTVFRISNLQLVSYLLFSERLFSWCYERHKCQTRFGE